ncbi:MAG: lipooligosaccharide sialyltransferase [Lachnospiraceae bacterium]|nr:lipooligosaccharide sialyltransferase [Lachnospiraceae bacterium]
MNEKFMKGSIYVCHTYYHVYVTLLKEFAKPKEEQGKASIVLSNISTDFEELPKRLEKLNIFQEIFEYDEKDYTHLPEVMKYHHPSKFFLTSLWNRYRFTKLYGKMQEKYIPTDFKQYKDVYVFCDSDPIGYYLNWKHIYYHAVEDGLDTLRSSDLARVDNASHFELKVFLSKKCNLLFIQNGYAKYCLDMEVNDISILKYPCPYYVEVPRAKLMERLTKEEKKLMLRAFVKEVDKIETVIATKDKKTVMILTEPLCDLDVRKTIFADLIKTYDSEYQIILKQHPRDLLDYEKEFSEHLLIDRTVPMEMLNFFENFQVDLIVSVFTELGNIEFAKERLRLGRDFMDAYEDREKHESRFESL